MGCTALSLCHRLSGCPLLEWRGRTLYETSPAPVLSGLDPACSGAGDPTGDARGWSTARPHRAYLQPRALPHGRPRDGATDQVPRGAYEGRYMGRLAELYLQGRSAPRGLCLWLDRLAATASVCCLFAEPRASEPSTPSWWCDEPAGRYGTHLAQCCSGAGIRAADPAR